MYSGLHISGQKFGTGLFW